MTVYTDLISDGAIEQSFDLLAETVSYTPKGGSPGDISAIVRRDDSIKAFEVPEGLAVKATAQLITRDTTADSGVATVTEGDSVVIDSNTYMIWERLRHIAGFHVIGCIDFGLQSVSAEGVWIQR